MAASGNASEDNAVTVPACLSKTVTVGALAAIDDPYIAPYSNHSRTLIDILAPGSEIRSAALVKDPCGWIQQDRRGGEGKRAGADDL